jgi:ribosomal protein L11 methyltransferase
VFANILESILLLEQKYLVSVTRPGGLLILSGLLNHQGEGIVKTYEGLGMKLINHLSKGDWSALSFKRELA